MKIITVAILVLSAILANPFMADAQCNHKSISKACKPNLKPFKYDGYAYNEITFDGKEKKIEVEFTAYTGQEYRLVFCSSGFKEVVQVNIYDKNKKAAKRNKLYDNSAGIDNNIWIFEPTKTGNYYIEYDIPVSADGKEKTGCMVLLIGYK